MISKLTKIFIFHYLLCISTIVNAAQLFSVNDGDSIKIKISSKDLSRITVEGSGRIDQVWGSLESLEIKEDKSQGQIFIKPRKNKPSTAVSFFIKDDVGSTYTIIAEQYDIPSQTVILKPKKKASMKRYSSRKMRSLPYVRSVKSIIRAMATGDNISSYGIEEIDKKIPLWKEVDITLKQAFTGSKLLGEVYILKNISSTEMTLKENEFLGFGDQVRAVALEKHYLKSDETTFLYIVRQSEVFE